MGRSRTFFRNLWNVNAVLILFAAGAIILGLGLVLVQELGSRNARNRQSDGEIVVAAPNTDKKLLLGQVTAVQGTNAMRAVLETSRQEAKLSSGYNSETRNILFILPDEKAGRWLLPDNDHLVVDTSDIFERKDEKERYVVATAVLVKPSNDAADDDKGRILLFNPTGKNVLEVATNVRDIKLTSAEGAEVSILYQRNRRLVHAVFDSKSMSKLRESEIDIPQLK